MYTRHGSALTLAALAVTMLGAACGGGGDSGAGKEHTMPMQATQPGTGGAQTPDPGGKVITVEMVTDDQGNNKFVPADFTANKGDVLRFVLVQGVHNAHFLPDSNPKVPGLPPMGPLLQMPGQTDDVKVTWPAGRYFFQCDPHALLGMVGYVTVQ